MSKTDLAKLILAKAKKGQQFTLTADTARFVGLSLRREDRLPTSEAIALLLCNAKCERSCYLCKGKANAITEVYGCCPERFYSDDSAEDGKKDA